MGLFHVICVYTPRCICDDVVIQGKAVVVCVSFRGQQDIYRELCSLIVVMGASKIYRVMYVD